MFLQPVRQLLVLLGLRPVFLHVRVDPLEPFVGIRHVHQHAQPLPADLFEHRVQARIVHPQIAAVVKAGREPHFDEAGARGRGVPHDAPVHRGELVGIIRMVPVDPRDDGRFGIAALQLQALLQRGDEAQLADAVQPGRLKQGARRLGRPRVGVDVDDGAVGFAPRRPAEAFRPRPLQKFRVCRAFHSFRSSSRVHDYIRRRAWESLPEQ